MSLELFDYRRPRSPFVDAFAHLSLTFLEDHVGIGPLHPRGAIATYHLTAPTLELWMGEDPPMPVRRHRILCLPDQVEETAREGGVEIRTVTRYLGPRIAETTFEFRNVESEPIAIRPVLAGRALGERGGSGLLKYFPGAGAAARELLVSAQTDSVEIELRPSPSNCDLPRVRLLIEVSDPRLTATTSPTPAWMEPSPWGADVSSASRTADAPVRSGSRSNPFYGFTPGTPLELAAGEVMTFTVTYRIALGATDYPQTSEKSPESPAVPLIAEADVETSAARARLRAQLALLRNGLKGEGGEFGDAIACLCTADSSDFSSSFFWDTLFSSVAISRFHPEYARGAIETAFVRQLDRDGSTPERKWNFGVPQRMLQQSPQSPVASWAVREYLRHTDDPAFLAAILPRLVANQRFWERFSDTDGDGLAEYRWSGQAADDSPLWDTYGAAAGVASGCGWLPPVASAALNSFLYWDAGHLADLACRLDQDAEAERLMHRRREIGHALLRWCYLPDEHRFWDYDHHLGRHTRVKTFYMFWPVVMGLEVPEETTRDLIENVLLDPTQFFGPVPFPSVAYDEPTYRPDGYWRGRAWPHISYWLTATLWRLGYEREADLAANRIMALMLQSQAFPENLATDPAQVAKPGFADYNWGAAAYLLFAERAYRQSILP